MSTEKHVVIKGDKFIYDEECGCYFHFEFTQEKHPEIEQEIKSILKRDYIQRIISQI